MNIDVIGDVHGHYDKLVALLKRLGYRRGAGSWRRSNRTAIFVGDLIDRGPNQLATVDLVRDMVDAGAARCVMGNHEFNAIAWATPDPDHPGAYLRPHDRPGNLAQHRAFLDEVAGTPRHAEIIRWFKTLPLWIDLGDIRIVHACWHQPSMDALKPLMGPADTLTEELLLLGSRKNHFAYTAIETICKGLEVALPRGMTFKDKEGKIRHEVRVRWWQDDLSTYRKAAIGPADEIGKIPDDPLPGEWHAQPYRGPPVLFGHYWFTGTPTVISEQFACLDYSAARGGPLVAYRWAGESQLASAQLAWV
jgi:hypothetical protein